jgi:hypothetical protein
MASKNNDSFYLSIAVVLAGLTKPGEVGEMIALSRLKSLSLDYKAGNVCLYILRFGI